MNLKIRLNWKTKRQNRKSLPYWMKQRKSLSKMVLVKAKNKNSNLAGLRRKAKKLMKLATRVCRRVINGKMALLNLTTMLISLHLPNKGHI